MQRARPVAASSLLTAKVAATRAYIDRARAAATLLKYERDWMAFSTWCAQRGQRNLPVGPETAALYLDAETKRGPTLTRKLSASAQSVRVFCRRPRSRQWRSEGASAVGNGSPSVEGTRAQRLG